MNSAPENLTAAGEYEWGIKYPVSGHYLTEWGFSEDPRASGVIDEDGEFLLDHNFRTVVAVGKRLKNPEDWTDFPS